MQELLKGKNPQAAFSSVESRLKKEGLEVGWGNTVGRISETFQTLLDLISEPNDQLLERFISRVPMPLISKVAIISSHGWFDQTNALGKPDTGGQVIYILDQVRALEKHLTEEIQLTGLDVKPKIVVLTRLIPEAKDTSCDQRIEEIFQTLNSYILRVPFRDSQYNVVKHWISRFKIWPYLETFAEDAARELTGEFEGRPDLIIGNYSDGNLDHPEKTPIFTMARFDKIKNITGLIQAFGMSKKLQQTCNLIFAAGTIYVEDSSDSEERNEIIKAYDLIESYNLHGKLRWLPSINKLDTGEVYRIIADHKGIFVQPALFEAFGLTIIEAMASGLPTFAPKFGGPLEIIEYGVSGFLMNTSKPELIAKSLESFVEDCLKDENYWSKISANGIKRVRERFNWQSYSQRMINLAKLYGFWRYAVSGKGMLELDRYCDLIYHFLLKQKVQNPEAQIHLEQSAIR